MGITIDRNGRAHANCDGHDGYDPGAFLPVHEELAVRSGRPRFSEQQITEFEAQKAFDRAVSTHVGAVGQRLTLPVTVRRVIVLEGFYGPLYLTIAHDQGGSIYVSKGARWAKAGDTPTIIATIKAHTERDGVKQNIIQRVKL